MKKILLVGHFFLWIGVFSFTKYALLTSFGEVPQLNNEHTPQSITTADKELVFIAGKDGKFFTEDDELYQYYLAEYDKFGDMIKKECFDPGEDKVPFNKDDHMKEYWVYGYNVNKQLIKEAYYKAAGQGKCEENYRALYELNTEGKEIRNVRHKSDGTTCYIAYEYGPEGKVARDAEYIGKGPDGLWFTPDDEIEKYHRREYGKDGRITQASEYRVDKQGKGPDDEWFTQDDVISSTKVFLYDKSGLITKINKYIGKGPDNTWFTNDDILQYYAVMYYLNKK
jgi:hypothetical protein